MKIKIDDNYQIVSDRLQYILQEKKISKEGKNKGNEYWNSIGYCTTLTSTLKVYKELKIRTSSVTTVNELIELINDLDVKIETLLKGN